MEFTTEQIYNFDNMPEQIAENLFRVRRELNLDKDRFANLYVDDRRGVMVKPMVGSDEQAYKVFIGDKDKLLFIADYTLPFDVKVNEREQWLEQAVYHLQDALLGYSTNTYFTAIVDANMDALGIVNIAEIIDALHRFDRPDNLITLRNGLRLAISFNERKLILMDAPYGNKYPIMEWNFGLISFQDLYRLNKTVNILHELASANWDMLVADYDVPDTIEQMEPTTLDNVIDLSDGDPDDIAPLFYLDSVNVSFGQGKKILSGKYFITDFLSYDIMHVDVTDKTAALDKAGCALIHAILEPADFNRLVQAYAYATTVAEVSGTSLGEWQMGLTEHIALGGRSWEPMLDKIVEGDLKTTIAIPDLDNLIEVIIANQWSRCGQSDE